MPGRRIHLIGIGGTGMGSLAILLKEAGHTVRGSDQGVYPPMRDLLLRKEIPVAEGYAAENLGWGPDLVVVGNVASRNHPEVRAVLDRGLPYRSLPQALYEFFLRDRHSVVVAGTHGKTTTASLLAWLLDCGGAAPGFLIGGVPANFEVGARAGTGECFIVEGDEYETAFFDKGPKMWHYRPRTALLTSVEFDHAEMFRDLEEVKQAFRRLLHDLPADGFLAVCGDDPVAAELSRGASCRVAAYGTGSGFEWRAEVVETDEEGETVRIRRGGRDFLVVRSPLCGRQNLKNLAGAVAAADHLGVTRADIARAVPAFRGVARRQEVLGIRRGIRVIDDFAHHPTAVRETLAGLKARYSGARLWAVFEPRTNTTRRKIFQAEYARAFGAADRILVAAVHEPQRAPEGDRFSPERLVRDLRAAGKDARYLPGVEEILQHLEGNCREGDVVVFLSNGAFGGIQRRFLQALG